MRTGRVFLQSLFFQRQGPRPPVLPPEERGTSRALELDTAALPAALLSPPAAVRGDRALGIPVGEVTEDGPRGSGAATPSPPARQRSFIWGLRLRHWNKTALFHFSFRLFI